MSVENTASLAQLNPKDINSVIIEAIQDIKGKNITKIDLTSIEDSPTDYFIICEGDSTTQVNAIAHNINKMTKKSLGIKAFHTEGLNSSKWVLVDFFDTVVHVFHGEARGFYDIEDLWSDGDFTEYQDL